MSTLDNYSFAYARGASNLSTLEASQMHPISTSQESKKLTVSSLSHNRERFSNSMSNDFRGFFIIIIIIIIIIIMSHRLSARWGQPFTGSDSSILVGLVQGGTVPVHCVDTTLLCHPATLYTDVLVGICRPF